MRCLNIILVFNLFILFNLQAQSGKNISFAHIHEGLPQKSIAVILQDHYGFMWFGTRYGLSKYDGNHFYTFRADPKDSTSLSSNSIRDMLVDQQGNFWIVSEAGGLTYFDYKKGNFKTYWHDPANPNSISEDYGSALFIDHAGILWIGTDHGGLNRFDPKTETFTRFYHNVADPSSISSNRISDIIEDDFGNLWIATQGGGMNLYNRSSQRFIHYKSENTGLSSNSIYNLNKGKKCIWLGTAQGPCSLTYNPNGSFSFVPLTIENQPELKPLNQVSILAILEDAQQNVWIGTENKGLYLYNKKQKHFTRFSRNDRGGNSIASNSIWSLYEDRSNNIWVGTFENGINEYDQFQQKFRHIRQSPDIKYGLSYNTVSSFVEDPDGNMWIGTDGGGLNYLNEKTGRYTQFHHDEQRKNSLASDAVLDLLIDRSGDLWIASWQGGLSKKIKGTDAFMNYNYKNKGNQSDCISFGYHLMEDHNERIWVSFYREGIGVFDKKTETFISLYPDEDNPLSISATKIRVMYEEKPGVYLLGSEGKGLDRIVVDEHYQIKEKKHFRYNPHQEGGISHNIISVIHEHDSTHLWIGTFGGGINIYHKEKQTFEYINEESGLPSNVIFGIEQDHHGDVWVSTSKGLVRINKKKEIEVFGVKDGLQNEEYVKNSSYIRPNGELFFGGINGFNRFFPYEIKRNTEVPDVFITGFKVFDKPEYTFEDGQVLQNIFPNGEIDLAHSENDFEFQVSVLNYSQSSKNKLAYMLYPYQENWEYIGPTDRIHFTNVPPGSYEFRVKGSNNDGVWNEKGAAIKLQIAKPWYATYSAYMIYGFCVVLLFFWERRVAIVRERLKTKLDLDHLKLTKLHELDELKSRFFANISHEFRTPLTLIIGPLKSLLSVTYKGDPQSQYRIMLRNAEKLLRLINQLLELSKLESGSMKLQAREEDIVKFLKPTVHAFTSYAERQIIDYKCEFPDEPLAVYFEKDKLEKIVVNLISNAIKYTPEFGKVVFSLRKEGNEAVIEVKDTGIGIPEKQLAYVFDRFYQVDGKQQKGTGIGLALTKELVELHKGSIQVESEEGSGATFTVKLKLGKEHLEVDEISMIANSDYEPNYEDKGALSSVNPNVVPAHVENDAVEAEDGIPIILLAEDNDDMRLYISEFLDTKYRLIEAKDGAEAIELAKKHIPDIIVTDVMMPHKDGYEVVEEIKKDEKTSHIPIIMLTAKASQESALQGFEIGVDYYVTKPFNPKLLELRINNILKTKERFRERLLNSQIPELSPKEIKIASKDQLLIKNLMKCIEDNMSNSDFTVDDICKELGMSRTQLYRKIKGLVGQTANEFIRSMRLKRAAQLLKQNEMTIAEVTYQVGFNDLQYFRFCFKKQYGVNPSEYLKKVG